MFRPHPNPLPQAGEGERLKSKHFPLPLGEGRVRVVFILFLSLVFISPAYAKSPLMGVKAPDFNERDLEGRFQSPSNHAGQYLVIYFWGSWCPSCSRQAPHMRKLFNQYARPGLAWISVALDENLKDVKKFTAENGTPYPVLFDGRIFDNKIAKLYGVSHTPAFFLIDRDGNVMAEGAFNYELTVFLETLVKAKKL